MKLRRWTKLGLALATLTLLGSARAQTEDERRARVALRVGPEVVTVGQLEDRLAAVPPFQVLTFGPTRDAIARKFLEDVVLRDLLLQQGASARGLTEQEPWRHQLARARSSATLRAARSAVGNAAAVPAEDVKRFYEENRSRFESPERMNVWRILARTEAEALSVLATARADLSIPKWTDLARERSIDKATNLRGGNLGFLAEDGTSNEAGLKVDPALVAAAKAVKDGELAPRPVPEAGGYAVIWRRATVPATKRSFEESEAQIRATLQRTRTESAERKLIDDLRAARVSDVNPELLKIIELGAMDAGLTIPRSVPTARPK
jgi:peptidyl-prolyl cis-trans isomerase C